MLLSSTYYITLLHNFTPASTHFAALHGVFYYFLSNIIVPENDTKV